MMMNSTMRNLPIGIQTFEDIRTGSYLYMDKTAFVWKIANTGKPLLQAIANEALQQIDDKGYLILYQVDGRKVRKIGVEFSAATRNIDRWLE